MKSLDIDSLESAEIILAVECAFDVSFSDEELEQCETVGDLFHCLKHLLPCKSIAGKCVTSMAFYRVRRALKAMGIAIPITPKTTMHTLSDVSPLELNRSLNLETISTPTFTDRTSLGYYGMGGIFLGIVVLFIGLFSSIIEYLSPGDSFSSVVPFLIGASLLAVGTLLYCFDKGVYTYATVGDCAKLTAYSNLEDLIKEGAGLREDSLWEAFCWIIAWQTDVDPYKIKLETTFY